MSCDRTPEFLGAYVLGALDDDERRDAELHLRECPVCAAELEGFRGLTQHLDRVGPEDLEPVHPSPDLYARVEAAALGRRTRRRWLVAAAAAALVAVGGTAALLLRDDELRGSATEGEVWMSVVARERGDGAALDVTVDGLPENAQCRLFVVDGDGTRHRAGEWTVSYQGEASYAGWTDVDTDDMTDVVLLGADERELLRVPLRP